MTTCGDYSELGPKLDMLESELTAFLVSRGQEAVHSNARIRTLMQDVRQYDQNRGTDFPRDLDIGIWEGRGNALFGEGRDAIVVQIDTGDATGRLRVNVNDGAIYDGNPETDEIPGDQFQIRWEDVHVPETVARTVLDFFEGPGAGHFYGQLIQLILAADNPNAEALGLGFREWVRAVGLWKSDKQMLRKAAGLPEVMGG